MTPNQQFWWNWWVQLATAGATFLAVVVALFLDWFRARFFPPRLALRLVSARGTPPVTAFITIAGQQGTFQTDSRWYHLQVENSRRMSRATDTQVCLLSVGVPNAAGQILPRSTGAIPLKIRHEGIVRPGRIIGPSAEWDLCSIFKQVPLGGGPIFELQTIIAPTDLAVQRNQAFRMVLTFQARAIEADSNILTLELSWDGKWSDDTDQMANHLVMSIK